MLSFERWRRGTMWVAADFGSAVVSSRDDKGLGVAEHLSKLDGGQKSSAVVGPASNTAERWMGGMRLVIW